MPETKIKITPVKGRPMLNWIGKKPLDYVKGFPTQLIEVFDPQNLIPDSVIPADSSVIPAKAGIHKEPPKNIIETPTYNELKDNWQNLLFHGDNKDVLSTLLELGFRGKIDLIYIDPPFKSGADYVRKVELRGLKNLGRIEEDEASVLQQTMYFDIWNNDTYLQFMYERLILLKELLADTGSIYVHLDWHIGHYIKILMDEVFGQENFRNEIIWYYRRWSAPSKLFQRYYDYILWYTKSHNYTFNELRETPANILKGRKENYQKDENGKLFRWQSLHGKRYKIYRDEEGVLMGDVWEISFIHPSSGERTVFATQKPEALLERIIKASSNEGNIVLDCFCGSGTTLAVAQKLGRRWIGCDINKGAIQLTAKRIMKIIQEQLMKEKKDCLNE